MRVIKKQKAEKAEYWESKAEEITLATPESLEYFKDKLEKAIAYHAGLKKRHDKKEKHSLFFNLMRKKDVNELTKKVEIAKVLWGIKPP